MLKNAIKYTIKYNKVTKKVIKIRKDALYGVERMLINQSVKLENRIEKIAKKINELEDEIDEIDYEINNNFEWEVEDFVLQSNR